MTMTNNKSTLVEMGHLSKYIMSSVNKCSCVMVNQLLVGCGCQHHCLSLSLTLAASLQATTYLASAENTHALTDCLTRLCSNVAMHLPLCTSITATNPVVVPTHNNRWSMLTSNPLVLVVSAAMSICRCILPLCASQHCNVLLPTDFDITCVPTC
jgi:hypothetical protein